MLLSVIAIIPYSAGALTSGDYTFKILKDGKAEITKYNGSSSSVSVPNTINGYSVEKIGEGAFSNNEELESVIIEDGIEAVDERGLAYCSNLNSVTIPKSIKRFGEDCFIDCDKLKKVYISDLSAWCKIVFKEKPWVYEYASGNPLINEASLYLDSEVITDLVIPDDVTKISNNAFERCKSIKSVTVSENTSYIGAEAFMDCNNLGKVSVSDSVSYIGSDAFLNTKWYNKKPNGIYSVGKVADYKKYDKDGYLIEDCLPIIVIIQKQVNGIMGKAFKDDEKLHKVILPSKLKTIGDQAFRHCDNLLNISIPKSVKTIDGYALGLTQTNDHDFEPTKGFKLYGYKDTAAEKYAKSQKITFKNSKKYSESKTIKIKAGVAGPISVLKSKSKFNIKTSNKKVVKVNKKAIMSTLKKGKAKLTIKVGKKTYKFTIKVTNNPKLKIKKKAFSKKKTYTIKKGKTLTVKISGKAENIKNTYKSSKKKIAKVISKRTAKTVKIKGCKKGKAKITITVNGVKFKIKVRVK